MDAYANKELRKRKYSGLGAPVSKLNMRADHMTELNTTGNSGTRIVVLLTFRNEITGSTTQIGSSCNSGGRVYLIENSRVTRNKRVFCLNFKYFCVKSFTLAGFSDF
jgi:hypothetical protein